MKEKKWFFFRVMVYLCLVIAGGIAALIGYTAFEEGIGRIREEEAYAITAIAVLLVQVAFNILNIRLVHHYFFLKELPDKKFNGWHMILLILNVGLALLLLYLLYQSIIFTFRPYRLRSMRKKFFIQIAIICAYLFITITTIIGAIRLRNYIRRTVINQEDKWLNSLGT